MVYRLEILGSNWHCTAHGNDASYWKSQRKIPVAPLDCPKLEFIEVPDYAYGPVIVPELFTFPAHFGVVSERAMRAIEHYAPDCAAFHPVEVTIEGRAVGKYFYLEVVARAQRIIWSLQPTHQRPVGPNTPCGKPVKKAPGPHPSIWRSPAADDPKLWREQDLETSTDYYTTVGDDYMDDDAWKKLDRDFPGCLKPLPL